MNVMDTRQTSALLYLDGVHVSFDGFHGPELPAQRVVSVMLASVQRLKG